MLPTRWILVCLLALSCAACAARVQPRLDAGLGAQWHDGPAVSGNLGLGKYEATLAPPPLAGAVPPLSPEGAPPAPVAAPEPTLDSCAGGRCLIPPPEAAPSRDPPQAPAQGDGGAPWPLVAGAAGVLGLALVGALARRRAPAAAPARAP